MYQSPVQLSRQLGDLGAHETCAAPPCKHDQVSVHTTAFIGILGCNPRVVAVASHIMHDLHCLSRAAATLMHTPATQHQANNAAPWLLMLLHALLQACLPLPCFVAVHECPTMLLHASVLPSLPGNLISFLSEDTRLLRAPLHLGREVRWPTQAAMAFVSGHGKICTCEHAQGAPAQRSCQQHLEARPGAAAHPPPCARPPPVRRPCARPRAARAPP